MNIETQILIALSPFVWVLARTLWIRLRSQHYAGLVSTGPQPCPCGSHDKKHGSHIVHWWSLSEWITKLEKIRNRKGKRKTKLSRQMDALDALQKEVPKTEEEFQERAEKFERLGKAYETELLRVAGKQKKKWMLCRHCHHVSQRSMHSPEVIEFCDFNHPDAHKAREEVAYQTFFALGGPQE